MVRETNETLKIMMTVLWEVYLVFYKEIGNFTNLFYSFCVFVILISTFNFPFPIKGVLHLLPQKAQKLACFVLYPIIINICLKNNTCIL